MFTQFRTRESSVLEWIAQRLHNSILISNEGHHTEGAYSAGQAKKAEPRGILLSMMYFFVPPAVCSPCLVRTENSNHKSAWLLTLGPRDSSHYRRMPRADRWEILDSPSAVLPKTRSPRSPRVPRVPVYTALLATLRLDISLLHII